MGLQGYKYPDPGELVAEFWAIAECRCVTESHNVSDQLTSAFCRPPTLGQALKFPVPATARTRALLQSGVENPKLCLRDRLG